MRQFKALFVAALALALAAPAFAETQNVKVSGSIDAYFIYRENYDLRDDNDAGAVPVGTAVPTGGGALLTNRSDADEYARTNTQVEISADLTDNVSTVINLVNQRDWNADQFQGNSATATSITANEFDIELDLAYVQMKEIFYSPLTLTVGRQDMWFGRGLIIGNNNTVWDSQTVTQADEYSVTTAFDAIRATLDFNPWTLDLVWSKIDEGNHDPEDDINLYIANVNYKFAEYNAVAEGYYIGQSDRNAVRSTSGTKDVDTHTFGARVQFDPISQITLGAELAYQTGNYQSSVGVGSRDRQASMFNIFGTYRWDNTWKPEVTVEYLSFSGDSNPTGNTTDGYGSWNGLYIGRFYTAISDFREFLYATSDVNDVSASTNKELFYLKGSMKPLDDLLLEGVFAYMANEESIGGRSTQIGWEIDLQAVYDYTEDVQFGLLAGWFVPGDFYASPNDETATDLVSSVKVAF